MSTARPKPRGLLAFLAAAAIWSAQPLAAGNGYSLPLAFEPVSPHADRFVLRRGHYAMIVAGGGFDIRMADGSLVELRWIGARPDATPSGLDPLPGKANRYRGSNPALWQQRIPTYSRVRIPEIYPGIDVVVYSAGDRVEYDFAVAPGADVSQIRLNLSGSGASRLAVDEASGDLIAEPSMLRQRRPRSFQERQGARTEVTSQYRLLTGNQVEIEFGAYDRALALTVDPEFVFSTYLGGTETEYGRAVAVDANFIYVAGTTYSTDFPRQAAYQTTKKPVEQDAFVAKINRATKAVVFSTYLGSGQDDRLNSIAIDSAGGIYVTGSASGADFPLQNPLRSTLEFSEVYVTKLTPSGTLVYSTFLGGDGDDSSSRIVVDASGNAYVAGTTTSSSLPGATGYRNAGGQSDVFVTKLNASGSAALFTLIYGGAYPEEVYGLAVDTGGNVLVSGSTNSADFPVTAGFGQGPSSSNRPLAFVSKFDAAGAAPIYSRVFGVRTADSYTTAYDLALDPSGNAVITGLQTQRSAFPLANEFQSLPFASSCYVARFAADGAVTYASPIGNLHCSQIEIDGQGRIWLGGSVGATSPPPLVGALPQQNIAEAWRTLVVLQMAADGQSILFSTALTTNSLLLGGMALDGGSPGSLVLAGTATEGFPLVQPIYNFGGGALDSFVSQYSLTAPCTFTVSPGTLSPFPTSGGTRTITVTTQSGCYWNAIAYGGPALSPTETWTEGTGSGTVNVSVPPTGRLDRSFEIVVAGKRIKASQLGSGCTPQAPNVTSFPVGGGTGRLTLEDFECVYTASANVPWITIGPPNTGNFVPFTVAANSTGQARTGRITIGASPFTISQDGGVAAVTLNPGSVNVNGLFQVARVTVNSAGAWSVRSNVSWMGISAPPQGIGSGNGVIEILVERNDEPTPRTGTITVNNQTLTVNQEYRAILTVAPSSLANIPAAGASGTLTVTSNTPSYSWVASGNGPWIKATGSATGNGTATYSIDPNPTNTERTGAIFIGGTQLLVTQAAGPALVPATSAGLYFRRLTPCRLVDTREERGDFGKPSLFPNIVRTFRLPQAACGVTAAGPGAAYSLNVTVVPKGPLGYLTIWPAGAAQPFVSTLNSPDGRVKANAAIVPAGVDGAISLAVTDETDVVIDINGEFLPAAGADGLVFHPVTPCRIADTRGAASGPAIPTGGVRSFSVTGSSCGIPASAQAYSLNATLVASSAVGYITMWATGQTQPFVSTLNAPKGGIVANAAIVPAGGQGSVSVFASNQTHLVIDINGYFARPGDAPNPQRFFPVPPCRLLDTRNAAGDLGGPVMESGQVRSFGVRAANCQLAPNATAYSLNATVVPAASLGYLTLWATGQTQPFVSTLNAIDDKIVANAALVPSGAGGAISAFVTERTHLVVDTNGYFAP